MSSLKVLRWSFAPLALGLCAGSLLAAASSEAARIDRYEQPDGRGCFALRLAPPIELPAAEHHDIVVLFDTSASQVVDFRDKALAALDAFLAALDPQSDRVHLVAVDVDAVPLTPGFVAANSDDLRLAIAKLRQRAPLGATDLPQAIDAAIGSYSTDSVGVAARAAVYFGDGESSAALLDDAEFRRLTEQLVAKRLPLSAYAIGPRIDVAMLAAIVNYAGGTMVLDGRKIDAKVAGTFLADGVHAAVAWPQDVAWPESFRTVYPAALPPLRGDRETVVIGVGEPTGALAITVNVEVNGQSRELSWELLAGEPNEDFSYLSVLVGMAKRGTPLPVLGTPGLEEVGLTVTHETEELAKLAAQALSSGNLESAGRLADEVLRRDSRHVQARALADRVRKSLAQAEASAAKVGPTAARKAAAKNVARSASAVSGDDVKSDLRIEKFRNEQAAPPAADEAGQPELPADGSFLDDELANRQIMTGMIRSQVENLLKDSRRTMDNNPGPVITDLKTELERVERAPELNADVRAQLRDKLSTALAAATSRKIKKDEEDRIHAAHDASLAEIEKITQSLDRREDKLKQLMDRFDSLLEERNYPAAEEISAEVEKVVPDSVVAVGTSQDNSLYRNYHENVAIHSERMRRVVDTLTQVERSHIPYPDDVPIVYPDATIWQELTIRRRARYSSVDLKRPGSAEEKINRALGDITSMEFADTPLSDVIDQLKEQHGIEIQLDSKELEQAGVGAETTITKSVKGITLKNALKLVLSEHDLAYVIKDEVLLITTKDKASLELSTRVYPVADLVLPIQQSGNVGGFGGLGGGMGGMGGGGMGGGMGGMGGGMGGMGGGMGGMGGGMGGMGGGGMGMGGGMFSVPDPLPRAAAGFQAFAVGDDLKISGKAAPAATAKPAEARRIESPPTAPVGQPASKPAKAAAKAGKSPAKWIVVDTPAGQTIDDAWDAYFAAHENVADTAIRETVRRQMHEKKFDHTAGLVKSALRHGHAQPWMYEVLGLALQMSGGDQAELERALMSAVDLSESPEDVMNVAQYMARIGLESRALKLFRLVSRVAPYRPEPYRHGLSLSQRVNDAAALQWATLGVLSQEWPADRQELVQQARRVAAGILEQLISEGREAQAEAFQTQLDAARQRDCIVRVTWHGDADVDLLVEEPTGSVCSFRNPRTTAGGAILGDTATRTSGAAAKGLTETYVCPEAFSGTYKLLVRRVWGNVATGKVTVEVVSRFGTPEEKSLKHQLSLGEAGAAVMFDLADGRRTEPVAEQQLANAVVGQLELNRAVLAQQLAGLSGGSSGFDFANSRNALLGGVPILRSGVGFQPVIITLPAGANFAANGVVSADRRYVRITALPIFSQISQVTTFNIATGATNTTNPPPAGGGGVAPPPPAF